LTFVEIGRSAGRFRGDGSVKGWVFGIAANIGRHHVRGEVRRRLMLRGVAEGPARSAGRPDDDAERQPLLSPMGDSLARLPHDLRAAFVLCDLEDLSGVEAARALGVPEGTLWRRLHEARKALRASLEAAR